MASQFGLKHCLIWAGEREDMPACYNALDVAISSSREEGFPNVVGESMACGVPVVVTDAGDSSFIVGHVGDVVPVQAPEALATAIDAVLRLSSYDRQIRISNARKRICDNFSIDALCRRSEMVLSGLLRARMEPR